MLQIFNMHTSVSSPYSVTPSISRPGAGLTWSLTLSTLEVELKVNVFYRGTKRVHLKREFSL